MTEHLKFTLFRETEAVAQGVVFCNGKVTVASMAPDEFVSVYDSADAMYRSVCRNEALRLVWGWSEAVHFRHLLPVLNQSGLTAPSCVPD
jgi:hypothetical protein